MTSIQRLPGETDEQLVFRACRMKPDLDCTWNELGTMLNSVLGKNIDPDSYRRKYQTFSQQYEQNQNSFADGKELADLEKKKEELRKERIKLQTCNVERNRIDREEARQELFYEYVGQCVKSLEAPNYKDLTNYFGVPYDMEYLLTIADVHDGYRYDSQNNSYDQSVVEERFNTLLYRTADFIHEHNVKKLNVAFIGDNVNGLIHVSALRMNETSLVKSVVHVAQCIGSFLNALSEYVNVDALYVAQSNHGQIRLFGAKANELPEDDLEYVIGAYVSEMIKNNTHINFEYTNPEQPFVMKSINGIDCAFTHGQNIKNLNNAVKDASNLMNKNVDVVFMAHRHAAQQMVVGEGVTYDKELIVVPAFMGSDPYSDKLMLGCKASCGIYGFSDVYGHTETYKIILN